jgi:hypothetical protein
VAKNIELNYNQLLFVSRCIIRDQIIIATKFGIEQGKTALGMKVDREYSPGN